MAFGGPRSSCVHPDAHSARRQDSRNDLTPCRMALHFVSAGAHAPHPDETPGPTATRGASHSARHLRSLAFLCSSGDGLADPQGPPPDALHEGQGAGALPARWQPRRVPRTALLGSIMMPKVSRFRYSYRWSRRSAAVSKADSLYATKPDSSICCQHFQLDAEATELEVFLVALRGLN